MSSSPRTRLFGAIVLSGVTLGSCGRTPPSPAPPVVADAGPRDLATVPPDEAVPPDAGAACDCDGFMPCCTAPDGTCYPCFV